MAIAKKFTALVVEGDSVNRATSLKYLSKNGFEIDTAKNGLKAVEYFRMGFKFDLVLIDMDMPMMDMGMPVMDGIQATLEIRALGVRSLIIGMSSTTSQAKIEEFVRAGLDHCYPKPMNMAKLIDIISHLEN